MDASSSRVFYYHADASPLGGYITHPFESVVPSQASSSLAPAGGYIAASVDHVHHHGIVSCKHAYSHISGAARKGSGGWATHVTSVVEGLNVQEVVTADRIVASLAVDHPHRGYIPEVTLVGTQFVNLRIAGRLVAPVLDLDLFCESRQAGSNGEKEERHKPWPEDPCFLDKAIRQSSTIAAIRDAPDWLKKRYDWVEHEEERRKKGYVLCSLVKEVKEAEPETAFGHVVHVPGFGNVFLGELIVDQSSFRLTMLRIEMGCLAHGTLSFTTASSNGFTMP
jgi:hypothetical protein